MLVTESYRAVGAERVDGFFSDARAHGNDAGAGFNATRVVGGLKRLAGQPLQAYLREPSR